MNPGVVPIDCGGRCDGLYLDTLEPSARLKGERSTQGIPGTELWLVRREVQDAPFRLWNDGGPWLFRTHIIKDSPNTADVIATLTCDRA